jgi:hypothetical protein
MSPQATHFEMGWAGFESLLPPSISINVVLWKAHIPTYSKAMQ